jgi:RNA polymerase sigma-70 factor (ECF subfamily)
MQDPAFIREPAIESLDDFDAIYVTYYQDVFKTIRSVVLDASMAEDVTQDAFVKAYKSRASYRPISSIGAWLHTIALREALSKLRWLKLQERVMATLWHRREATRPTFEERDFVARLLATASPRTRAAIGLYYYHGYRYREIAVILGVPEGTVATRISNGLKQIRSSIEAADEEDVSATR